MSYRIVVRQLAEQDLFRIRRWYDNQNPGLGSRFQSAVDEVVQLLVDTPLIFPAVYGNVRRASLKGYPYILYYMVRSDRVRIFGCFHARRNPQIVLQRLERYS